MSAIKNVAIIMDGNGRWAREKNRPRVWGHIRGSNRVTEVVQEAIRLNLDSLTLYAFSTENWTRPTDEITNLFKILKKFLIKESATIIKNNIRFEVIGNYKVLDSTIVEIIESLEKKTKLNTGMNLSLAINYGGKAEIVDAVNKFIKANPNREITESDITENLYSETVSNIDLLIRTAGDTRVSNFLLWQISYAEFFFTGTKWPDFSKDEFRSIIQKVSTRERRFGGLKTAKSIPTETNLLS